MNRKLLLIDAIGPFFRQHKAKRINWSKVPFESIETSVGLSEETIACIESDFRTFAETVRSIGYNAVSLDDIPHLMLCSEYSESTRAKIETYQQLYRRLLSIAAELDLSVFFTMDIMFFNSTLEKQLKSDRGSIANWLNERFDELFEQYPSIAGIVMRFGEQDGVDVQGEFLSRLLLKTPDQCRRFLQSLLPVFEKHERLLIFRTWSVGAYRLGDLIWNPKTFDQVFSAINSSSLVISMKYGETDFFRYLNLNQLFLRSDHQKIIEFQARREYEGFGAYPSFVGWDTEKYLQAASEAKNLIGTSVWCQTGGWGKLRQLTYIRNSSVWVELNVHVIAKLCQGFTCAEAIQDFRRFRLPHVDAKAFVQFLELAEFVIKKLLYVSELAEKKLFFRRLRLPPQLFVFWDRIIIDHSMKKLLANLVTDRERALREGQEGLEKLRQMITLAKEHGIPKKGLKFQLATFEILAAARTYFFSSYSQQIADNLEQLKATYKKKFKRNYSIVLNFEPAPIGKRQMSLLLKLLLRSQSNYRIIDQIVILRVLAWGYPLISRISRRYAPKFASRQAMGIDVIFR